MGLGLGLSLKKKGGGLVLYVSEGLNCWLREFTCTKVIAIYIPLSADTGVACEIISSTTAGLQTEFLDAFKLQVILNMPH